MFDYILVDSKFMSKVDRNSIELLDRLEKSFELVIMKSTFYEKYIKAGPDREA